MKHKNDIKLISCCFECGKRDNLHLHHVIPQSLGGRSMVGLCEKCHGLIHGMDFTHHGNLIRLGLERAKENGVVLGRPKGTTTSEDDILKIHADIVEELNSGNSIRKIARVTGKGGSTVQRVKKILEKNDIQFKVRV